MEGPKAIIADDEEQLRIYLRSKLSGLWPELDICGEAANGLQAQELIEKNRPQIAFLDINMPGLSGLEVAKNITFSCRVVFITAYDQYAIEAFENEAIDYLLKPVSDARLAKTVKRLQQQIADASPSPADLTQTLERFMSAMKNREAPGFLKWIKVRQGEDVRLISVHEICYFKAEDKYTVVKIHTGEFLIKKSIRQLAAELDPDHFWRIHRGAIINVNFIDRINRSFSGRLSIKLEELPEALTVSRSYAHLFKQM
jgi:DNA-binding LytR/AlgR family response regulator